MVLAYPSWRVALADLRAKGDWRVVEHFVTLLIHRGVLNAIKARKRRVLRVASARQQSGAGRFLVGCQGNKDRSGWRATLASEPNTPFGIKKRGGCSFQQ